MFISKGFIFREIKRIRITVCQEFLDHLLSSNTCKHSFYFPWLLQIFSLLVN
ncbi:hypothetical protein Hanom_Chr17g01529911 [Helianthus anomalus]